MRHSKQIKILLGTSVALFTCNVVQAKSLDTSANDGTTSVEPAKDADAQATGSNRGEGEIVVTATKRADRLQDVPVAISSVDGGQLAQANITSVSGVQNVVPNLRFTTVTGTPLVYVRGVGGGGRNIGFAPRTGVYIDGVFMGDTAALDAVLVGIDRVEVLRGPQGFLFGQSTDAGAINIVTKAPGDELSFDGSIAYGRWNDLQLMAHADVPLSDDISTSITAVRRDRDGYVHNIYNGKNLNDINDYGVRSRTRFKLADDFTFDLTADYSRTRTHLVVGEPITDTFGTGPSGLPIHTINQKDPELDERWSGGVSGIANYDGEAIHVTSITAYREASRHWMTDTDHSPENLLTVDYHDKYRTFSQEVTLSSNHPTDKLRWIAGVYFSSQSNSENRIVALGSDVGSLGLTPGAYTNALPMVDTRTISGYGSIDWEFIDRLSLNVGVRVQNEQITLNDSQKGLPDLNFAEIGGYRDTRHETHAMPTASITWKPTPDVTLYGKYARGVKSGGFNADFVYSDVNDGLPYQFKPETVDSYEAGLKGSLLQSRLTGNFAVFLNNFKDYQVFQYQVSNGFSYLSLNNAGKVRTYGIEAEIAAHPIDGLNVSLNGSRLVAKYQAFPDGGGIGVDYDGNRLEYAPKWNFSGHVDYTIDTPVMGDSFVLLAGDYSYRSNSYADASNDSQFYMKAANLLAARVGFGLRTGGKTSWQLTLSGENLLNSKPFTNISVDGFGTLLGFREIPRRWLAKLEFHY